MLKLSYVSNSLKIPAIYAEGHSRYWNKLANPGNWFTGHERVEMAREVRSALDCET